MRYPHPNCSPHECVVSPPPCLCFLHPNCYPHQENMWRPPHVVLRLSYTCLCLGILAKLRTWQVPSCKFSLAQLNLYLLSWHSWLRLFLIFFAPLHLRCLLFSYRDCLNQKKYFSKCDESNQKTSSSIMWTQIGCPLQQTKANKINLVKALSN